MTIASEFYEMAVDMLGDPEIGFDGSVTVVTTTATDPTKPWIQTKTNVEVPIRLFYTTQKGGFVNGSPVLKGEKVFICYQPDWYNLELSNGWDFTDHTGRKWKINAVESIGAGNTTIVLYLKIGV